jgi:Uri superfamily endonuclease
MITAEAGTYALISRAKTAVPVSIGKLGCHRIEAGYYVYVGSAFGPGGLNARLAHHLRNAGAPHWHMDYLRPAVDIIEVWFTTDRRRREHQWAESLTAHQRASLPIAKFGASDCTCSAHLFRFGSRPSGAYFRRIVQRQHPGHGAVRIFRPFSIR